MSIPWDVGCITCKRAELNPNKSALIFEDQPVTYKELNERINRCAHFMQKKGLKKGDRIAVLLLNCVEFLEAYFAAAKLGIIFVPLNWRLVPPELEYQINDSGARMLLFHDSYIASVEVFRNRVKTEKDKFIYIKSGNPGLPECPGWAEDYHALVKNQLTGEPTPDSPVKMDDPLAIVYTSGTTGDPKGAVLSHEQTYFKNFQVSLYTGGAQEDAVVVANLPLFHSGGLFIVATPAICGGITLVMRRGFNPKEFLQDVQRYRGTIIFNLTTMWRMILLTGMLDHVDVSSVKTVVGGGERTEPKIFEELAKRGLHLQQGFGQTECSAMTMVPKEDIDRKMGSIGKPGFFTEMWIEDSNGKRLPPGEIGEIVSKGPTVMSGYWNMPEATAKTIVNGILHTGDLGYMDEDGFFYVVDRAKDMYRSGGENVYPAEVEKVMTGHPKISNVAIIGVPDPKWGETGLALIILRPGEKITEEEVREFLEGKVSKFKYPSHIKFVESLPLTSTMKVKKALLKEMYARGKL